MSLDLIVRFDRQPKLKSPRSFIGAYNITIRAPKHERIQLIDIDGNITRQTGLLQTYNSIAYRVNKTELKELNVNFMLDRDNSDGSVQTHVTLALPFKYIPYITHDLMLERASPNGRLSHVSTRLLAKPVLAHFGHVDIDRSQADQPPRVHVDNEIEYLRGNGDILYGLSKVDVHRWSTLHSLGILKRNTDLLHKHSIGYIFNNKTRKVALSLESPQLSGNPLSIIGELTIDRENRIGKMKWPQQFGVHVEFGTPLSNVTALQVFYNLPMFHESDDQTVDAALGFKLASTNIAPISFYLNAEGSLNTTLHVANALNVGDDIALTSLLTAQYNPQSISQLSATASSKYYEQEFQHSLYALFKQHQVIVRGILNTTDNQDYQYEMDIGFDEDLLTGHTERTDGQHTTISDIDAKKCHAHGKYYRCYKGDITIRTGTSGGSRKGTFDVSWGRGTAKLDVAVPGQIDLKFDHTHTGRVRDEDFSSKTMIEGKSLRSDNKGAFSYAGSVEKEDGKWNDVQLKTSLTDMKTGQKSVQSNIRLHQNIKNKLTGEFQRKINLNLEHKGQPVIDVSTDSVSCPSNPANVLYGVCQTATFNVKASNQLARRLRERLHLPPDPKLSNQFGQMTYDGTLKLDLKHDPKSGPHKVTFDLNRAKEDAVDVDLTFQPRVDQTPMNIKAKVNLPKQNPISFKYDETRSSSSAFTGTLKYSFNANDNSAEKTYQCNVDRPDPTDVSINCKGERTTLTIDFDRKAGKSKAYIDLNKYHGERVGYEGVLNPQTKELDATIYTFVSSWHIKRNPGRSTTLTVQQKNQEVLRIEGTKVSNNEIQVKFSPSNIHLKLDWDNSTGVNLRQTSPQTRNLAQITIDRARIRQYLPSLRNQNRPAYDIDEPTSTSRTPLFSISLDSHVLLSLSQALDKLGSHNGHYGVDTIKKAFKLQIGDAPLILYNVQHWKTHREHFELPESYSLRIVNPANGNIVQLSTTKWNEHRLISKLSHSLDSGKTLTTDLKVDRNYALQVGSIYFFHSLGYRNVQGGKQLRNITRHFIREHLMKDLNKTQVASLVDDFRKRLRSIIEKDYAAVKEIVNDWNKEPESSFLRRLSTRLGLRDFFDKYPTYTQASERISAILRARAVERQEFWRNRIEGIMNENRLKGLAERFLARREALIKRLLNRADQFFDRVLPKVNQAQVEQRITDYVGKLLAGFEQSAKRNNEVWKTIFKAIDDASKGEDNKWFRTLVADIDSNAYAAAADAELAKMVKKMSDSSKLIISNIQKLSRRITKRRESIRERVKNFIRHLPLAYVNESNFELLFSVGRQPASYIGTSELLYGIGSLLRNRDQAIDTIRCILQNHLDSRLETTQFYMKALRQLAKRLLKRHPSLTPEFKAVIGTTGDVLDVHGEYIHLRPECDYILAHDFDGLQFSFEFKNSKVHSLIPKHDQIDEHECAPHHHRVQVCNHGNYYTINIPMYYGNRVNGAIGNVGDRSGKGRDNLGRWSSQGCSSPTHRQSKTAEPTIVECLSGDDDEQEFCENFVQNGKRKGLDQRRLIAQALEARKDAL